MKKTIIILLALFVVGFLGWRYVDFQIISDRIIRVAKDSNGKHCGMPESVTSPIYIKSSNYDYYEFKQGWFSSHYGIKDDYVLDIPKQGCRVHLEVCVRYGGVKQVVQTFKTDHKGMMELYSKDFVDFLKGCQLDSADLKALSYKLAAHMEGRYKDYHTEFEVTSIRTEPL